MELVRMKVGAAYHALTQLINVYTRHFELAPLAINLISSSTYIENLPRLNMSSLFRITRVSILVSLSLCR